MHFMIKDLARTENSGAENLKSPLLAKIIILFFTLITSSSSLLNLSAEKLVVVEAIAQPHPIYKQFGAVNLLSPPNKILHNFRNCYLQY